MPKGFFTQAAYVLFPGAVSVEALDGSLRRYGVSKVQSAEAAVDGGWMGGFASVLVPFRPEVNGYIAVSAIGRRYPDGMGDPKTDVDLFGAWAMGWMGPFTYPGNLGRALRMCHEREATADAVNRHAALVRILSSYSLGAVDEDKPVLPADYEATPELERVTDVARAVLELPEALAYFNPAGETIFRRESFDDQREYHQRAGLLPLPLWSCVRWFNLSDSPGWTLMDTVGMEQLDAMDMEACFETARFDLATVANFLRNATDYVRQKGPVIKDGDTMDGPGKIRWRGMAFDQSFAPRPRPTIRWFPLAGRDAPTALTGRGT